MKKTDKFYYDIPCDNTMGKDITVESLKDYMAENQDLVVNPHTHDCYEMIWFKEGGCTHIIDFKEYDVEQNMVFFLAPGQIHKIRNYNNQDAVLVRFHMDFINDSNDKEALYIRYNTFNASGHDSCCTMDNNAVTAMAQIVDAIKEEQDCDKAGHAEALRALAKLLFIHVHRNSTRKTTVFLEDKRPSHRLFHRFRNMLEKDFRTKHMVNEYATELEVSTKSLSNCIVECTGNAPLTVINDRILLEAKRLLAYSDMMTRDVAKNLNFEDPSYFSKFFKRETGFLPSSFKTKKA